MNFSPAVYAMANAGTVMGCSGCLDSINVYVAATTHMIIDVMGNYEPHRDRTSQVVDGTGLSGGR